MGWNIVRGLHPLEPSKHNRLWIKEEIEDILVNELGTDVTRSIKLKYTSLHPTTIMRGLRKMRKLRFLSVQSQYWNKGDIVRAVDEVSQYLPDALQSLYWPMYPFRSLPQTFQANKLVNLEMFMSNISELWEGGEKKVLNKIRFIELRYSKLETFDLSMTPNLKKLNLEGCCDLFKLHIPVECPKLKFLKLGGSKVSILNLGMTPHLEELNLSGCNKFVELHMPIECRKLKFLNLGGSKVSILNLGMTPHLEELNVTRVFINSDIQEIINFKKRSLSAGRSSSLSGLSSSVIKSPSKEYLSDFEFSTIGGLNGISETKSIIILGTIKSFASKESWLYNAC
ncbi:putative leucine-rich repeat domain superfamily [Helianthus debilis subsp. tardiflorus]